jgi:hypothetical protein
MAPLALKLPESQSQFAFVDAAASIYLGSMFRPIPVKRQPLTRSLSQQAGARSMTNDRHELHHQALKTFPAITQSNRRSFDGLHESKEATGESGIWGLFRYRPIPATARLASIARRRKGLNLRSDETIFRGRRSRRETKIGHHRPRSNNEVRSCGTSVNLQKLG